MFYKSYLLITIFFFLTNCTTGSLIKNKSNIDIINGYSNKGFALIYSEDIFNKKIVNNSK